MKYISQRWKDLSGTVRNHTVSICFPFIAYLKNILQLTKAAQYPYTYAAGKPAILKQGKTHHSHELKSEYLLMILLTLIKGHMIPNVVRNSQPFIRILALLFSIFTAWAYSMRSPLAYSIFWNSDKHHSPRYLTVNNYCPPSSHQTRESLQQQSIFTTTTPPFARIPKFFLRSLFQHLSIHIHTTNSYAPIQICLFSPLLKALFQ